MVLSLQPSGRIKIWDPNGIRLEQALAYIKISFCGEQNSLLTIETDKTGLTKRYITLFTPKIYFLRLELRVENGGDSSRIPNFNPA